MIKRCLFLSRVWPAPNASAAGTRSAALAAILSENFNSPHVTFAAPAKIPRDTKSGALAVDDSSFTMRQTDPNDSAAVLSLLTEFQPDLVLFDTFTAEEMWGWHVRKHCPNALTILDTQDLHALRLARKAELERVWPKVSKELPNSAGEDSTVADFESAALRSVLDVVPNVTESEVFVRELSACHRCDLTVVVSTHEESMLLRHGLRREALVRVPFSFNNNELVLRKERGSQSSFANRESFMTLGHFGHAPNLDSLAWLVDDIWPRLQGELWKRGVTGVKCEMFGSFPDGRDISLRGREQEGIFVRGYVDDHLGALSQHRVLLAPLRFGAGVKGKIVDAWSVGTPVVTTKVGSEGFDVDPCAFTLGDSAADFARKAAELFTDVDTWQRLHVAGFNATQHFKRDSEASGTGNFINTIRRLVADLPGERRSNVTGAMLWRGTARGLEYFSRWIELKNANSGVREENSNPTKFE